MITEFLKNAVGLTKNPLGIIGLFISLIYGFACLVLSSSIENLTLPDERLPLIWFIIVFPIIILTAFIFLVVNHHEKLYAPSDFRNDDTFIQTLSTSKIREKQEQEAELLESAKPTEENGEEENSSEQDENVKDSNGQEIKAVEKGKEFETKPIIRVIPNRKESLSERIKNTQEWVVKDLQLKYMSPFSSNRRLVSSGERYTLDAYSVIGDKIVVAEIKYWESKKTIKPLLLSIQHYAFKLVKLRPVFKKKELELIIVIVFDELKGVDIPRIKEFVANMDDNIKLELKEYSELYEEYN